MNSIYLNDINQKRKVNFYRLLFTYITSFFIGGVIAVIFFQIDNITILFTGLFSVLMEK